MRIPCAQDLGIPVWFIWEVLDPVDLYSPFSIPTSVWVITCLPQTDGRTEEGIKRNSKNVINHLDNYLLGKAMLKKLKMLYNETHFHRKKGKNFKNNRDRYRHVYIFLNRKKKENFFEKCLSVRPSVRKSYIH